MTNGYICRLLEKGRQDIRKGAAAGLSALKVKLKDVFIRGRIDSLKFGGLYSKKRFDEKRASTRVMK